MCPLNRDKCSCENDKNKRRNLWKNIIVENEKRNGIGEDYRF